MAGEDTDLTNNGEELSEEQLKEKKNKDQKKFEEALKFVTAVVGGAENLKGKKRVKGDQAAVLVADLFREEQKELQLSVRNGLKELLKKYAEMEAEVAKKQKELDELRTKKQKEFTKAVNDWKQKVEQGDFTNEAYTNALKIALEAPKEDKPS